MLPPPSLLPAPPASSDPHHKPRRSEVNWPTRSATFLLLQIEEPHSLFTGTSTCRWLKVTELWKRREERWWAAMSRPDLLPRQIFLWRREEEAWIARSLVIPDFLKRNESYGFHVRSIGCHRRCNCRDGQRKELCYCLRALFFDALLCKVTHAPCYINNSIILNS